jgi:Kelch motif protein/galactose oxidase-like protein
MAPWNPKYEGRKRHKIGLAQSGQLATIATGLLACTIVAVLLLSSYPALSSPSPATSSGLATQESARSMRLAGASALAEAEASLANGSGPAGGIPMTCESTASAASCSSRTGARPVAAVPIPASSYPPTPKFPDNSTPPARYGASISIFENGSTSLLYNVLLFGGANSSGHVFDDTWVFDQGTLLWSNDTPHLGCPTSCPSARHDASATWDYSSGEIVLFGGCKVASPGWTESVTGCPSSSSDILNDTWTYSDPTAGGYGAWTKDSVTMHPSARYAEGLADNNTSAAGVVLLFGGCGVTCPLGDTWKFVGGAWTNLSLGTHPSNRFGMGMAMAQGNTSYGCRSDCSGYFTIVVFGGCTAVSSGGGCANPNGPINDTWLFYQGGWHTAIAANSCSATIICPTPRYYMGQTSYQSSATPWKLLIYGGAGPEGVVLGNGTNDGDGWWAFASNQNPAAWAQFASPPGFHSGNPTASAELGWWGPYPIGPPVPRYDPMLMGNWDDGGFLFGGSSATGSSLGDTWWAATTPNIRSGLLWPPPVPSAEYAGAMVYDGNITSQSDVLFGGCGPHCGNVTTWNYTANWWTPWSPLWPNVNASNSPPGRMNASMIFFNDSTKLEVVLFGGIATNGTLLNDTWIFGSDAWGLAPIVARTTQPSPRQSAAFAYNTSSQAAVLFGGCGATCPMRDTWELEWLPIPAKFEWFSESPGTKPAARYGASMTYDPRNGAILLFGGCGAASPCSLADTWTYTSGGTWTECTAASCTGANAPSARWGAAMTYDSAYSYVVLFGGCGTGACPMQDTWRYASGTWTNLSLSAANSPPASYDSAVANDTRGGDVLLVGGIGLDGDVLGSVGWEFQGTALGGTWTSASIVNQLPRAPVPSPRVGVRLAYNSTGEYVLLVGGCQDTAIGPCGPLASHSDTWEFVNGTWRRVCTGCGPSARWDASLVFDVTDNYFLLVGGCEATVVKCGSGTVLDDVWKFGAGSWVSLASPPFLGRGDASMTWDGLDNYVLLFGGIGCSSICDDSWRYAGGTWTSVTVPSALTARFGAAIGYDANPSDKYVIMWSGQGAAGAVLGTTWKYTGSAGWVQLSISGPTDVYDASMTYDASDGYLVLFGGLGSSGGVPSAYMWEFHSGAWTAITLYATLGPSWGYGLVYDPAAGPNGFTLLFGGSAYAGVASTSTTPYEGPTSPGQGDTWEYLGDAVPPGEPTWTEVGLYT